ncbi:hypothetical protein Tco_0593403 [Tanacetum coccineum]
MLLTHGPPPWNKGEQRSRGSMYNGIYSSLLPRYQPTIERPRSHLFDLTNEEEGKQSKSKASFEAYLIEKSKQSRKLKSHSIHGAMFIMDDPNITMEEYIRLEEEKVRRQGRTFNWQTAKYRKMEYYKNEDDSFTDFETEYSAIVLDDAFDTTLSCEPTVKTDMAPLPHRDLRHPWLRYQVNGYDEGIVHSYEQRLKMIWGRPVNRVDVLDFTGLTDGMRQTLGDKLSMVYAGDDRGHCLLVMRGGVLSSLTMKDVTRECCARQTFFMKYVSSQMVNEKIRSCGTSAAK